jgi:hypothetical protein
VPLDATSLCNALESLTRNAFALPASTSELEASQIKHTQGQHIPKVLNLSQARAPPLFIAPKPNRAVRAKLLVYARAPDTVVPSQMVKFQWLGHRIGGGGATLGVAVTTRLAPRKPSL